MQIFCRGTVYAKGAKGDIFMYITQFGPEQARYAALNRKNLRSLHKGVCYD